MPVLFLVLACVLWGLSFPLVKVLHLEQSARLPDASSLFLSSWLQVVRALLAAAMLLPFVLGRMRPVANEVRQGLIIALWGGCGMWLQADGLAHTEASTSAFLTQAYCVVLPLYACLRLKKPPAARVVYATLLVLLGGAILSGLSPTNLRLGRGELETITAAFLFCFQILALENPRYRENRGLPVTFVMFCCIAVIFVPITLMVAPGPASCIAAGASWRALVLIASLSFFCSVGSYVLMNTWQRHVSATEAGLIYTSEPVFTSAFVLFLPAMLGTFAGCDYPNETLTTQFIVGGSLILAANVLMQWKRNPHTASAGPV